MTSIGDRLREERERLDLSQPAVADIAGVTMRSQRNYEKGDRAPDATYLAAIAKAGADVQYIVTGVRSSGVAAPAAPAAGAKLDPYVRRAIEMVMEEQQRRGERHSARVFIKLVEDAARYLRQGAELERRMKTASKQEVVGEKTPHK